MKCVDTSFLRRGKLSKGHVNFSNEGQILNNMLRLKWNWSQIVSLDPFKMLNFPKFLNKINELINKIATNSKAERPCSNAV